MKYLDDSVGAFWNYSTHGSDVWTRADRVLDLNDGSFLEVMLFEKSESYFSEVGSSVLAKHKWGVIIRRVYYVKQGCYIRTFADGDCNGIPDVVIEERITGFKHQPSKRLSDYYNPFHESTETIAPAKFEGLSDTTKNIFQAEYSAIIAETKEKMDSIKLPSWQEK